MRGHICKFGTVTLRQTQPIAVAIALMICLRQMQRA